MYSDVLVGITTEINGCTIEVVYARENDVVYNTLYSQKIGYTNKKTSKFVSELLFSSHSTVRARMELSVLFP